MDENPVVVSDADVAAAFAATASLRTAIPAISTTGRFSVHNTALSLQYHPSPMRHFQSFLTRIRYADMYFCRLNKLKPAVSAAAAAKWPHAAISPRVLDIQKGSSSVIIGTLYKHMKLKPNILDEYAGRSSASKNLSGPLVSDSDTVVIEDESGRIQLKGASVRSPQPPGSFHRRDDVLQINAALLCTGAVVAVLGSEDDHGNFLVQDCGLCYAGIPPSPPAHQVTGQLLFVSGLRLGGSGSDAAANLLLEWLAGFCGVDSGCISACVLLGNGCAFSFFSDVAARQDARNLSLSVQSELSAPCKKLDEWLAAVAACCDVVFMPGESDPSSLFLPQAPFHHCFVSTASTLSSAVAVSNPCELNIGAFTMIATAGQSVSDLLRYCSCGTACDAMQAQLEWRHLAPTAPDTMACYPFVDSDPFLLEDQSPHLYVAGNQAAFEQRVAGGVKLIAVPDFSSSGEVVLFDLASMTARSMLFRADK